LQLTEQGIINRAEIVGFGLLQQVFAVAEVGQKQRTGIETDAVNGQNLPRLFDVPAGFGEVVAGLRDRVEGLPGFVVEVVSKLLNGVLVNLRPRHVVLPVYARLPPVVNGYAQPNAHVIVRKQGATLKRIGKKNSVPACAIPSRNPFTMSRPTT